MSFTPEQKAVASERAKARWAKKKAAKLAQEKTSEITASPYGVERTEDPKEVSNINFDDGAALRAASERESVKSTVDDEMTMLQRQVLELKQRLDAAEQRSAQAAPQAPQTQQAGQVAGGQVVGLTHRFSIDPRDYEDPTPRLAKEPRLQNFAFGHNYALTWAIGTTQYKTIDNIHTIEPKFDIELHRIVLDEDGEPTNQRYKISGLTFHEDPTAALTVARDNGIDVSNMGEREFLNEMRYLRARDWLMELFYPPKKTPNKRRKEAVIDNRLVYVFEAATPLGQSTKIDYDELRDGVIRTS